MRLRYGLELGLWDCRRLRSPEEVVDLAHVVRGLGLLPAENSGGRTEHPQPTDDLASFLPTRHHDWVSEEPDWTPRRGTLAQDWVFPVVHPAIPAARATMSIEIRHPATWAITVSVHTFSGDAMAQSRAELCEAWGELLDRAGRALYRRAGPVLAAITALSGRIDQSASLVTSGPRRRLVVGWRTWFGPPYVAKFGRDWLLRLPDGATELEDGGVYHQLAASATAMATGDPAAFEAVEAFLRAREVPADWPPIRPAAERRQARFDPDLTRFRQRLARLLGQTYTREDGERVTDLSLDWPSLSVAERQLALATVREFAEAELAAHPGSRIALEFMSVPPYLRAVLDDLEARHPRFVYTELDSPVV